MQVFNVFSVNRGSTATITESGAIEIPALNYGVRIAITEAEAQEAIASDKITLSVNFDVQDEELFFNEITLNKVTSQSENHVVFCGGCYDTNMAFYSVTAIIAVGVNQINFYFSTNF